MDSVGERTAVDSVGIPVGNWASSASWDWPGDTILSGIDLGTDSEPGVHTPDTPGNSLADHVVGNPGMCGTAVVPCNLHPKTASYLKKGSYTFEPCGLSLHS